MDMLTTQLNRMAEAANGFCALVDDFEKMEVDAWLERLANILPELQHAITELDKNETLGLYEPAPDYDARFALFTRLYEGLGERGGFDEEFDRQDGQRLSGSLADDITDIYFDLKRGLSLLKDNPDKPRIAMQEWQSSFELHWRHHLTDVERQLHQFEPNH